MQKSRFLGVSYDFRIIGILTIILLCMSSLMTLIKADRRRDLFANSANPKLCGQALNDALDMICQQGFFNRFKRNSLTLYLRLRLITLASKAEQEKNYEEEEEEVEAEKLNMTEIDDEDEDKNENEYEKLPSESLHLDQRIPETEKAISFQMEDKGHPLFFAEFNDLPTNRTRYVKKATGAKARATGITTATTKNLSMEDSTDSNKNNINSPNEELLPLSSTSLKQKQRKSKRKRRHCRTGIVYECCQNGCYYSDLMKYCI